MKYAVFAFALILSLNLYSSDWPVFKGNLYFTANNDEITVKNSNLKWLFQADERVFNPVISDGMVFFPDMSGQIYCLEEDTGRLIWKNNMREIAAPFAAKYKAAGRVKYPLVKGDMLFLTDPVAIYAFNKRSGKVIWARTGMRNETPKEQGLSGRKGRTRSGWNLPDPVILNDRIFYGTRELFTARDISNGHDVWYNEKIKSYSAFPMVYDNFLFTQSMDYGSNEFAVYCLDASTGVERWSKKLQVPVKIFPPVVYNSRVYIASTTILYCLNLESGEIIWQNDFKRYITSNPSFTDRAIMFTVDNESIAVINPENGNITREIPSGKQSGPAYASVRDQLYIASNFFDSNKRSFGNVDAVNFEDGSLLWNFKTPFPGGISQPAANGGILFLPCGNYMYAIGAQSYPRIVQGGSANSSSEPPISSAGENLKSAETRQEKLRDIDVSAVSDTGEKLSPFAQVRQYDEKGNLVYSSEEKVRDGKIKIPSGDNVEVMLHKDGYIPDKKTVSSADEKIDSVMKKIEKGRSLIVDNVLFEFNKAYLKKQSLNILDELVRQMKANPGLKVEIRGFTDSVGDEKYNQRLSEKRADSVCEYVIKNGISPERIKSKGYGAENPVAPNDTAQGREKNRRTEFFILDK